MGKIKFYFSILTAKVLSVMIATLHRSSGTSFVGLIVLKICPKFLSYCSKYTKKGVITISGTNGKTTTAGLSDLRLIMEDFAQNLVMIKQMIAQKRQEYSLKFLKTSLSYFAIFMLRGKYKKAFLSYQLVKEIYEGFVD